MRLAPTEIHPINNEAWDEWVEFRHHEKRKKIGPMAEAKQKKLLEQYPPPIQQHIIDLSIQNSWQGLFAPRNMAEVELHKAPEKLIDRTNQLIAKIDWDKDVFA